MGNKERSFGKILQDIFSVILIALTISVILKVFFIGSSMIPSSSMENTLKPNDLILIWKFLYNNKIPLIKKDFAFGIPVKRNDIIVFRVEDSDDEYCKRVIGLPGDRISLKEDKVIINGVIMKESYVKNNNEVRYLNLVYDVPLDQLFVLGDNRNNSRDSRVIGFINRSDVRGKVFFIYYPFSRLKFH